MIRADKTLDIRGLAGPRPEMVTGNTLAAMEDGEVLTVITTDQAAKRNLPLLCEHLGCRLLGLDEERGALYFKIRKGAGPGKNKT